MGKLTKQKENILKESETEILLKDFFTKMKKVVGEEYTILTLSSDFDINESLSIFTSKFQNIENNDIIFILLKNAILSNEDNYFNEVVKEKASLGELQDLLYLVNENLSFRKSLTRTLMNQSDKSSNELYLKVADKKETIDSLSTLNFYEINLKSRKLEKAFLRLKK